MRKSSYLPLTLILLILCTVYPAAGALDIKTVNVTHPDFKDLSPAGHGDASISAVWFYGTGCSHCTPVRPLIDQLAEEYPMVQIQYREISFNATTR